jgi:hypothetical protein
LRLFCSGRGLGDPSAPVQMTVVIIFGLFISVYLFSIISPLPQTDESNPNKKSRYSGGYYTRHSTERTIETYLRVTTVHVSSLGYFKMLYQLNILFVVEGRKRAIIYGDL